MTRVTTPRPRQLTAEDYEQIARLNAESDHILDNLFSTPEAYDSSKVARLNEIDITIATITGEQILIDNINI